ncbi:MAG TPA: DUF2520 domain-containing protein, partial [Gemmatimonadaceae bacterium]|nr:DUF2520 domain-containing protein [Gemmatimonadaceae bacterium]
LVTAFAGSMEPVVLVGAGRAGRALAAALRAAQVEHALVDREGVVVQHGAARVASRAAAVRAASTILVAVRDGQLDVALDELRTQDGVRTGTVVLQVSGSAEPAARERIETAGLHYGTFHPLLPLIDPSLASVRLQGSVIGIEGDAEARAVAGRLAVRLGATTIEIPRAERAAYHAAAVIASNFPVTLAALAEGLLSRIGVDALAAHRAVRALMAASVENLAGAPRALDALTGPIARSDVATVRAHATALHGARPYHEVYEVVSRATLALMRERGDDATAMAALESALDADGLR